MTIDEIISNMNPGEWYEIPQSKLSESGVLPDPKPLGLIDGVMAAWSGGVYDTKRDMLLIWGGGHTDYAGNEIYAFDMNTLSWSRLWGPTPNDQIPTEGTHISYDDGNPSSRHTYNSIVYLPEPIDAMLNTGGSRWKEAEGALAGYNWTRWVFDLTNLQWEFKDNSVVNCDSGIVYDPITGKVYCADLNDVWEYDLTNDYYVQKARISGGWWAKATADIDPINRKMFFIGGVSGICRLSVFDLETNSYTSYTEADLTGDTEILCAKSPGFAYDPTINKFVVWSGEPTKDILSETVYVIDPDTLVIEKRYAAETNNIIPTNSSIRGTYGRFRYIPSKDVYVVVNSIHENVYIYKLSNISDPPEGYGSTEQMGELRISPTRFAIGIEWDIDSSKINRDINHNAKASVEYRIVGYTNWKDAQNLIRIDTPNNNMMAGSIMYLTPDTDYEVRLTYTDPDGGSWIETNMVTTKPIPAKPINGNIYYVMPGTGGGYGSKDNPFLGINEAKAAAQPGDTFLLTEGVYDEVVYLDKAGSEGNYIVWQAIEKGNTIFSRRLRCDASYNWFEGINIVLETDCTGIYCTGDSFDNTPKGIVITNNTFSGAYECNTTFYFIHGNPYAREWYITDNTITGPYDDLSIETFGGEGIDMGHHTPFPNGHTIAHNSISRVGDGISYVGGNCDIFGNDIFDVVDDGIEPDYGCANVRIYNNRITNAKHNAISLQDMENGTPWYIIRNQIIGYDQSFLKIRQSYGNFIVYHNTVVSWGDISKFQAELSINGTWKNNIFISMTDGKMWDFNYGKKTWKTDIDFNGFDWGNSVKPFAYDGRGYANLEDYSLDSGLDLHSLHINKYDIFESIILNGPPPEHVPAQHLNLKAGCNVINAGIVLPNINDGYLSTAPDLGAIEFGMPLPHYGPRTGCNNICIGNDLYSQKRDPATGTCVPDQLIESNSELCEYDPCEGVVCDNICDGFDLWSQKCDPATGICVSDQLLESNSELCEYDPCEGVVCDNICDGFDLWSQKCDPATGTCVSDQLLESNSELCEYDPCEGVVCDNICDGFDLWSQKCDPATGICVSDQLLESNSELCEYNPCEGVVCPNVCVDDDLWSQRCDPDTGQCVLHELIEQDSINCKIPEQIPSDETTIQTYLILGGIGIIALAILMAAKKS